MSPDGPFAILFFDKSIVHFGCKLYLRQSLNVIFGNLRKCGKMLELNFGRPLHVGVQHYLSDFPATQISKKPEHNTSRFSFSSEPLNLCENFSLTWDMSKFKQS